MMITRGLGWQKWRNISFSWRNMWICFLFPVSLSFYNHSINSRYFLQTLSFYTPKWIFTNVRACFHFLDIYKHSINVLALLSVNVHEWRSLAITTKRTRKTFHIFYAFFLPFHFFFCLRFFFIYFFKFSFFSPKTALLLGSWNLYFGQNISLVQASILSH